MKISDVKFEEHFLYISRDILRSALHKFSRTTRDVITPPIRTIVKRQHLQNKKRHSKKENVTIISLKSLSNKQQLFFIS